jgi:hypothetical protein
LLLLAGTTEDGRKPQEVIHSKPLSFHLTNGKRKRLANRSVVLYQRIKIKNKWGYRIGGDPGAALAKLEKKRLEVAYVAASGEIKMSNPAPPGDSAR